MPLAELILDTSPTNVESFYFKLTDQTTSLVVLLASRDQFKRFRESLGEAPGLYILQAEDSTLYVGQSKSLGNRLRTHRAGDKIKFRRVMAVYRDQGLSKYLDYCEAKLYQLLEDLGYRLEQTPLTGSLEVKQGRLMALDREHVATAEGLIRQFLSYAVALGLSKPSVRVHEHHHHIHVHPTSEGESRKELPVPVAPSSQAAVKLPTQPVSRPGAEPGALPFAPVRVADSRPSSPPVDDSGPKALRF